MKTIAALLLLLFGTVANAFLVPSAVEGTQTPDPRDSIIVESKTVGPQIGPCGSGILRVRVQFTNKDSLRAIYLPLVERSVSGGAYATLSRWPDCQNRTCQIPFQVLLPLHQLPQRFGTAASYHSDSPDTFMFWAAYDEAADFSKVPPNVGVRRDLLEIKFDSVLANFGQFEIDSGQVQDFTVKFINADGFFVPVNFAKGIITVAADGPTQALASQVPDPRDSVIIESQYIARGNGACGSSWFKVKVWITNKDSLANITLPLEFKPVSGAAYATLSRSAACVRNILGHTFDFLYPPGPGGGQRLASRVVNYATGYHSTPPDTALWAFTLDDPNNNDGKMPPNLNRALLGEIKFDTVQMALGQISIDSGKVLCNKNPTFVNLAGNLVPLTFMRGVITVVQKGDLDLDGDDLGTDVILLLNCVFLGIAPPAGTEACDVNCDGIGTAADFVVILNAAFLGTPYPC